MATTRQPKVENDQKVSVVEISGLVALKIIKHCKENLPELVTGQLLGLDVEDVLEVTNCFPFPSRVDEEDAGDYGAEYQIEMMRCLREVNVAHNTVGWYRSTYLGSFVDEGMIETQYNYQVNISNCVVVVYDPVRTAQGGLCLKAYRLTDSFMALYRAHSFTQQSLTSSGLSFNDMLEEIPVRLSNSHLVNAFLYELEDAVEQDEEFGSLEFDRLDLGSSGFLEKSLEFMIECADDLAQEQNKMQVYQRNVMRQEQVRQSFIQNRGGDVTEQELYENNFKPIPQPSRLEALLVTKQIDQYSSQLGEFAAQSMSKMQLFHAGLLE